MLPISPSRIQFIFCGSVAQEETRRRGKFFIPSPCPCRLEFENSGLKNQVQGLPALLPDKVESGA
jgi:hypothetical protein